MTTLVKDLFELPEQIRKSDFVLKLSEGIERPGETVKTFVVTPALADAFERALKLVGSALKDGQSQAAYLHGSFGSGKSHFMAVLSLLLANNEDAWGVSELHPLRERAGFVETKSLLRLHFHVVGSNSIEEAIFSRYIEVMRERYPEAPVPPLFADEPLFDDAARMLASSGSDAFFQPMNWLSDAAEDGWGQIGEASRWTPERFDEARQSTSPKERGELFDALVRTHFTSYVTSARHAYVDLDSGLAVMARHAREQGHDAIVLFLDELILWLAARASDSAWLHNEAQKMVKLVEAQEARRDIPIVSFIARQRDLAEMVGEDYAGAENARLRDSLSWWKGRYDTITLEDRNLPAIVEKRVLRPRSEDAARELDAAFARMKTAAGASWQTMLGQQDETAFRKLYPFSPALVEALVALSNSLQRQRTAIKLLGELLFEHIEDLAVGEVVRVGDLFDVLASGEDTADGVMKSRFESARQLYRFQLLPMIQEQHGTTSSERCQRLREDHRLRIGCSNCPEKACRSDNRLVKTLIVAALVPEVDALKDATASRLVQLNHGTLRAPIPGTEALTVAQQLRRWASSLAQLHVDGQADPTVRLQLEGADIRPILDQARDADTPGAKQRVIRDLLFDAMGVEKVADWGRDHHVDWHYTRRDGSIRFGNVRKMGPDQLRCPEGHDWRLVVDYPFDDPGFGPNDDLAVVEQVKDQGAGTWTLVWLPSFFSESINKVLGEYVILQHILETRETARRHVSHLTVENQSRALNDLESLRASQQNRLTQVLEQAYGLATPREGDLDPSRTLDRHVVVLKPGAQVQQTLAANLGDALRSYVPALLEARFPRHPRFTHKLSRQRVGKLLEKFGELVDSEERRIPADRELGEEMNGTLGELGLVRTTEVAVFLREDRTLQEIENRRQQLAEDQPTVAQVRRWIDEGGKYGLITEAEDLVVLCYARWSARTLMRSGRSYESRPGQELPDDVVLEKPPLPSQAFWKDAITRAGEVFGVSLPGKALHADNLKRFEKTLDEKRLEVAEACARLPLLLEQWLEILGQSSGDEVPRLTTARSARSLLDQLEQAEGIIGRVQALAEYEPVTSGRAVGRSLASAKEVVRVLADSLVRGVFQQLVAGKKRLDGAGAIIETTLRTLRQDELNASLAQRLRELAEESQRLLSPSVPEPVPGPEPVPVSVSVPESLFTRRISARGAAAVRAELDKLLAGVAEMEEMLGEAEDEVELVGELTLRRRGS